MTPISRLWLACACIGAGTIHLAVGASAPVLLAIVLVGLGAAELGWGVATLVRGRYLAPGATVFGALVPVLVWAAVATLGSGLGVPAAATGLPLLPMATATLFDLFVAGSLAVMLRRSPSGADADAGRDATGSGWKFVVSLTLAALVVSGLTTPALAATEAGAHAVPHGAHGLPGATAPAAPAGHQH